MPTEKSDDQDAVSTDFEQRVRERAYALWEEAGYPEGDADAYWFRALGESSGGASEADDEPLNAA